MIFCFDETIQILNQVFLKDLTLVKFFDLIRNSNNYSSLIEEKDNYTISNALRTKNIVDNFSNEKELSLRYENPYSIKFFQKEIIIADNNIFSFSNNLENGILVEDYYYDKEDSELEKLYTFLYNLAIEKKENGTLLQTQISQIFDYKSIKR